KALYAARRAAIRRRAMVRNQRAASFSARVTQHPAHEEAFRPTRSRPCRQSSQPLHGNPPARRIREIVMSIPGMAEATAAIITNLPEIGTLSRDELATLTGNAP
ncbi:MAG: hypothetical protein ACRC6I_14360, partial [Paracoccaceae bacterium]